MVFKKSPGIEEAPLQGEVMLFDPGTSKFFVLNRTMAFVWQHCDGERSTNDILRAMSDSFSGVEQATAKTDLDDAVHELRTRGLIREEISVAV